MKKIFVCAALLTAPFSVAHAEYETRTVSWFLAHPQARHSVIGICADDPGHARHNANCVNARAANESASIDRAIRATDRPLLVEQCNQMPPLFQVVNHCGGAR